MKRGAFTLIELLVVIAIIAILAVVVVLTLNPAELLRQSRDANRVSDMATLNSAINIYSTDQGGTLSVASTSYISIPSASSSCATIGLATSAYSYLCSSSTNYRNVNSTGWIPINFPAISSGAPLSSLPVDPINQSSSNLYYAYETNGSQFVLSSFFESQKYAKTMFASGGINPALDEIGTGAAILPDAGRGLAGYWPLNEGSGSTTLDWSGFANNTGTWQGVPTGTSGYYSIGRAGQWAGVFDGSSTYVDILNSSSAYNFPNTTFTISAWEKTTSSVGGWILAKAASSGGWGVFVNGNNGIGVFLKDPSNGQFAQYSNTTNIADGNWHFVAVVITTNTSVASAESVSIYIDGNLNEGTNVPDATAYGTSSLDLTIGQRATNNGRFASSLSDVRVYSRSLSPTEIQEIYNAEK